ncbi:hypothetical protein ACFSKL_13365 [Belliella marina]|uniref:Uncharacterized protein n=1 Tax=Belliella marina TaxID=1644146 RepID=A0ABW4VQ32_9BACT
MKDRVSFLLRVPQPVHGSSVVGFNILNSSLINGVTKVINEKRRVIVSEDDLIASQNFLDFSDYGFPRSFQ